MTGGSITAAPISPQGPCGWTLISTHGQERSTELARSPGITAQRLMRGLPQFDDIRYFFYITNRPEPQEQIVFQANERCDQENLIDQLKNGVKALRMPVGDLNSNWAYMVMVALAWTLKAWFALLLPQTGRWGDKYEAEKKAILNMEFKTFLNAFMRLPCQVVRTGRRIVVRILAWNAWVHVLLRGVEVLRQPLRC